MPRRRRSQPSNLEALMALPWWGRAIAGLVLFVVMRLAAAALKANPITVFLGALIRELSSFALVLFALLAFAGLVQEIVKKRSAPKAPTPVDPWHNVPWVDTRPLPSLDSTRARVAARSTAASPAPKVPPAAWSLELLRTIEWHRFEELCAAYWREAGMLATTTPFGADGGVDIELHRPGDAANTGAPEALVQCKAWNTVQVGVKPVRELLGVVTAHQASRGVFMTSGTFTADAAEFARGNRLELIDGPGLLRMIGMLATDAQGRLLAIATDGDYTTPTCSSCGIKMVLREGKDGTKPFWGCRNFPKGCRQTLQVARS